MKAARITGATFAERMFMARCELATTPRVSVYEVDPTASYVRDGDYNSGRVRTVPREEKSWHGPANKKLCSPGFAAFAGSKLAALQSLIGVMRSHRDTQRTMHINEAIREVTSAIERESNACRQAV